jgi:hypothetical protein
MAAIRTGEIVVRDEPGGLTAVPRSYSLFGTASQALPDTVLPPDPANVVACSPGSPAVSRPTNVTYRTLAPELRFAHYAYSPTLEETNLLPELSQCYDVAWVSEREVVSAFSIDTYARLRLNMRTRFRWAPGQPWRNARTATYTWPESRIARECVRWSCTDEYSISPGEGLTSRWPSGRSTFQTSASITVDNAVTTEVRNQMTAFLQGRQRAFYDRVATKILTANSGLDLAVKGLNNAARQLQAYTRLGFPVALGADDILSSVLFGRYPIPTNLAGTRQLDLTFYQAFQNYACVPEAAIGEPCQGGPFYPLYEQPYLETLGGTSSTQPAACGVPTSWVIGLPGDVVGDCLVASAKQRVDALSRRYRHHSQLLADGVYVEELPWVGSTLDTLSLVDSLVRTPPSN